jgi:hypothetical protein
MAKMLVQQQVVIAEVGAAHVPVEVLRLEIEREDVGQKLLQGGGDFRDALVVEIGRRGRCFESV